MTTPSLGWVPLAVGLVCLTAAACAGEDEPRPNLLHLAGVVEVIGSQDVGGGGGLEWFRKMSPRWGFGVGTYSYGFDNTHWAFGRVTGFYNLRDWTIVSGTADVGAGRFEGEASTFQLYKAGVLQALVPKRLYLSVEEQYARYSRFEEPLLKAGFIVYPSRSLSVQSHYHVSTGGDVDSHFVSARVDLDTGPFAVLAGGRVGQAAPEPLQRAAEHPRAVETREGFAGVALPVGGHVVRVVLSVTDQSTVMRYRAEVSWTLRF